MKVELSLFGALRDLQAEPRIELDVADGASVALLRNALHQHARSHWPGLDLRLLDRCAFASDSAVLRDDAPVPPGGRIAVLPPVSGG